MKLRILGLANGEPCPFDGKYLVEYDPSRPGIDTDGYALTAHIVVTDDPAKALDLPADEMMWLWRKSYGRRPDGKPNRPLTAFTVVMA